MKIKFLVLALQTLGICSSVLAADLVENNGISYTILETRTQKIMSPECGPSNHGGFKTGDFSVETRVYQEYRNGVAVRSWTKTVYTKIRCD